MLRPGASLQDFTFGISVVGIIFLNLDHSAVCWFNLTLMIGCFSLRLLAFGYKANSLFKLNGHCQLYAVHYPNGVIILQIEGQVAEGVFIKRLNRFEAIVNVEGDEHLVHVPNTGRLKELLVEKAKVLVRKFDSLKRKTKYGLLLVCKDGIWVSIDSANVPNKIVYEALLQHKLSQFKGYSHIKKEIAVGSSRFDFGLFLQQQEYYIEVKGVTLVEDRKAYFPDAPTTRGSKHLKELIALKRQDKGAGVIFIVQRQDAEVMMPNDRTDQVFGSYLREAHRTGVDLWAYRCAIDRSQIIIDREIPVVLSEKI